VPGGLEIKIGVGKTSFVVTYGKDKECETYERPNYEALNRRHINWRSRTERFPAELSECAPLCRTHQGHQLLARKRMEMSRCLALIMDGV
jgi:hypothetical protein